MYNYITLLYKSIEIKAHMDIEPLLKVTKEETACFWGGQVR